MRPVLVDTGPLVAVLFRGDEHHETCVNTLKKVPKPLLTCWPVITEAAWLLRSSSAAVSRLLEGIDGNFLKLLPLSETDAAAIAVSMKKYQDIRPQLADVALVHLAARERIGTIFTLDQRDFSIYRGSRKRAFDIIPEL